MDHFNILSSSWDFFNFFLETHHLSPDSLLWDSDDSKLCLVWDKHPGQQ